MKIQKKSETDYDVVLWDTNKEIKYILKKIQKCLSFKGLYQVLVISKPYGIFLQIRLLEDAFYHNKVDFQIKEIEEDIYFETEDYFLLSENSPIYYDHQKFYGFFKEDSSITSIMEFGTFLFPREAQDKIQKSMKVII